MLTEQRHEYILACLKKDGIVKLQNLIEGTNASESTLRRDLQELENSRLLQRIHGGAKKLTSINKETTVPERSGVNHDLKNRLAQLASTFIEDGSIIFLDSGTSTKELVQYLPNFKNILVVTNSIDNASLLADYNIKTYLPGGILKNSTKALVGAPLMAALENYSFDLAFMGTNGFDAVHGYTTPDPDEASVKSLAINNAKQAFILADETKNHEVAFCKFASLADATLITTKIDDELSQLKKIDILEAP